MGMHAFSTERERYRIKKEEKRWGVGGVNR
jgi:hypothetical protein